MGMFFDLLAVWLCCRQLLEQERSNCHYVCRFLCSHIICVWLCEWWHVFSQWRETLDTVAEPHCISFPIFVLWNVFILNTIAIVNGSLAAIPFVTMVIFLLIWGLVSFPVTLIGTVVGRNWSGAPNNPCREDHSSPYS